VNVSCPECRSVFRVDPAKLPTGSVRARCSVCGGVITVAAEGVVRDEFASVAAPPAPAAARVVPTPRTAPVVPRVEAPALVVPTAVRPVPTPPRSQMPPVTPTGGPARPVGTPPFAGRRGATPPFPGPRSAPSPGPLPGQPPVVARPVLAPAAPPSGAPRPRVSPSPAATPPTVVSTPAAPIPVRSTTPSAPAVTARTPINPFLANDPSAKARRLARALISDLIVYFPQKREEGLRDGTLKQVFREEIKKSYEEFVEQVGHEVARTTTHFVDALNDILAGGQTLFTSPFAG